MMMFCPNCGVAILASTATCPGCRASFEAGSAWAPVSERPEHLAEAENLSSQSTSARLAFSAKVLALFACLGPLIAILGASGSDVFRYPYILIPAYTLGSALALLSWFLFSLAFALLCLLEKKTVKAASLLTDPVLVVFAAVVGALSGYVAVGGFKCSGGAWVHGGWVPCLRVLATTDYGLSIVPGFVCGTLSVMLWSKRRR